MFILTKICPVCQCAMAAFPLPEGANNGYYYLLHQLFTYIHDHGLLLTEKILMEWLYSEDCWGKYHIIAHLDTVSRSYFCFMAEINDQFLFHINPEFLLVIEKYCRGWSFYICDLAIN